MSEGAGVGWGGVSPGKLLPLRSLNCQEKELDQQCSSFHVYGYGLIFTLLKIKREIKKVTNSLKNNNKLIICECQ